MELSELVFVGFAKYVVALNRANGRVVWQCAIPKGKHYPALLLDRECLFVCAMGYTYCLDPWSGKVLWENPLEGMGLGVASITTVSGSTGMLSAAAAAIAAEQSAANGGGAGGGG